MGGAIERLSYDLLFIKRPDIDASAVRLVYLDRISHEMLEQPWNAPWDRSLHAKLINRLTAEGASAIVMDILFAGPARDPSQDDELAHAINASGKVVLAADWQKGESEASIQSVGGEELPYEPLIHAGANWGNDNFFRDPDYGVRQFFADIREVAGLTNVPWLPLAAARVVRSEKSQLPARTPDAWINYYCPPSSLTSLSYYRVLETNGFPAGYFTDKIVFVGGKLSTDFSGKGKDEYRTPYALSQEGWAPGAAVHAMATLNLLDHTWLARSYVAESLLVIAVAFLAGFGLMRFQPLSATLLALVGAILVSLLAFLLAWRYFLWFPWLIPVLQIAIALVCSVLANSLKLYVEKRLLEQSLSVHVSPKLVKRLLNDPALRQLGGTQQEISILFTDVANFSRISETVHSDDLVRLMNKYFDTALQCIHETDGTVIKLIGDSIFAVWNAPMDQPDHRQRACMTALHLREKVVQFDVSHLSLPLRTRVGVHAGTASVGNIGSSLHFDYTALGDNINLTSRLEGLNKFLGTSVLVTREVQRVLEKGMVWRNVGHFQFKGLGRVAEVHELVGPIEKAELTRSYREMFAQALHEFRLRQFDSAAEKFEKTIDLRRIVEPEYTAGTAVATADGPSRFYLDKIDEFRKTPPPRDWLGEIELKEK